MLSHPNTFRMARFPFMISVQSFAWAFVVLTHQNLPGKSTDWHSPLVQTFSLMSQRSCETCKTTGNWPRHEEYHGHAWEETHAFLRLLYSRIFYQFPRFILPRFLHQLWIIHMRLGICPWMLNQLDNVRDILTWTFEYFDERPRWTVNRGRWNPLICNAWVVLWLNSEPRDKHRKHGTNSNYISGISVPSHSAIGEPIIIDSAPWPGEPQ